MEKLQTSWAPFGKAIASYLSGNTTAQLSILMDDGSQTNMDLSIFFRKEEELPPIENYALSLCEGEILDVGAGVGCHSKILRDRDHTVTSIDVCAEAIEYMNSQKLHAFESSFLEFESQSKYDTLLFLMNGIGISGNLEGLRACLKKAKSLLNDNGQIILDSSDLGGGKAESINYRLAFNDNIGTSYQWLYLDSQTLLKEAESFGFYGQIVYSEDDGSYLAKLIKS